MFPGTAGESHTEGEDPEENFAVEQAPLSPWARLGKAVYLYLRKASFFFDVPLSWKEKTLARKCQRFSIFAIRRFIGRVNWISDPTVIGSQVCTTSTVC